MKVRFEAELDCDLADAVVVAALKRDYKNAKGPHVPAMFSYDPAEEKKQVQALRDAIKRVLDYYGAKP